MSKVGGERKLGNISAGPVTRRCLVCSDTLCRPRVMREQFLLVLSLDLGQSRARSVSSLNVQSRAGQPRLPPAGAETMGPGPSPGPQAHVTPRVLQSRFPDAPWGCRQARHPQGPGAVGPEEQPRASQRVAARPGCQGAEVSHPADLGSEFGYKLVNLAKTFFFTRWVVFSHLCF